MEGVSFLLLALAMSVVGGFVLWFRSRRPNSVEAGVESFSREMQALAPRDGAVNGRRPDAGVEIGRANVSDRTSVQEQ